jgi:tripartite-type tricarboxylate transporter receptor subunit TctC
MHPISRLAGYARPRSVWALAFASVLALAAPLAAQAQAAYPDKPIRFVVPYPPGGGTDVVARIVQPRLQALLGQSIVIDNRGGAGGSLGTEIAAKAQPDGYTVLFTLSSHTINPAIFPKLPDDTIKDFEPVGLVASLPQLLAAAPNLQVRTVADVVAQLVDDTALAGEEAAKLATHIATAMGRLKPGMGGGALPEVVKMVGRYEAALK